MWRKHFKRFGATVVLTVDFDGAIRFRFAKKVGEHLTCRGLFSEALLYSDGTVSLDYIKRWEMV